MSIIQEAIRKAQKTGTSGPVRNSTAEKEEIFQYFQDRPKKRSVKPILYTLVILALISVLTIQHFSSIPKNAVAKPISRLAQKAKPAPVIQPSQPPVVEEKPVVAPQPVSVVEQKPVITPQPAPAIEQQNFTLSGIMHLKEGMRAIINNYRVAEGDDVNGATVVSITDDSVVLKKNDSEVTLRLK